MPPSRPMVLVAAGGPGEVLLATCEFWFLYAAAQSNSKTAVMQMLLMNAENSMPTVSECNSLEPLPATISGTLRTSVERGPWHILAATRRWREENRPLDVKCSDRRVDQ